MTIPTGKDVPEINGEEARILIEHELLEYNNIYRKYWTSGMRRKLGLFEEDSEDEKLFKELLDIMKVQGGLYKYVCCTD